jgi:adenylyltransferase/sulfurtransferase
MSNKPTYEWGEGVYTLLSWFKQDRVKNARVVVAGAGALGNEVVKGLALFGVGHITVVDFDRIELSNLTRSVLFREQDAYDRKYKAEVVASRAMEINPQIHVVPIVGNLFSEVGFGVYRRADVVIGCLDSRLARYQLNRLCMRAGKSWIDGSIENLTGVIRVFSPGLSCYECGLSRQEFNNIMLRTGCADVAHRQTSAGRVATTPVSASIIGAMQVQEAMKIIHREEAQSAPFKTLEGRMLRYEGMTCGISTYRIASWKRNCPAHERWDIILPCRDLSSSLSVSQALSILKKELKVRAVEINMRNNKFVDVIMSDHPEKEFRVMVPESRLDAVIEADREMRLLSYKTLFHKHFYENIDKDFPYQDLTLAEIGLPALDVLQVSTDRGMFYVELSGDEPLFY